ncbi:hypothetical protein F5Y06DRAFT_304100 [Hypoxylon sp. FL0890]|nr:hypothetical protein F5Y06DRAFT_304100 [Hypoxylon sp. FL0890]
MDCELSKEMGDQPKVSTISQLLDASNPIDDGVQTVRTVWFHSKTLFLFTKSDFKTVMVPQSAFALALVLSRAGQIMAPTQTRLQIVLRVPYMLVWLWLHLLVQDIANQRLPEAVLEDRENKPWRPMPTKRLNSVEAQRLLRVAVSVASGSSLLIGSFVPSVSLMTLIWLYNDLNGSSTGFIQRNIITTAGLCCFGWGGVTTLLAGEITHEGKLLLGQWTVLTASVVLTTIQVQDFPDMAGDMARMRRTMPLIYGKQLSRWSLAIPTIAWSALCPLFWGVMALESALIGCIGGVVAISTILRWDKSSNEMVLMLWCCWTTAIYLLPLSSPT